MAITDLALNFLEGEVEGVSRIEKLYSYVQESRAKDAKKEMKDVTDMLYGFTVDDFIRLYRATRYPKEFLYVMLAFCPYSWEYCRATTVREELQQHLNSTLGAPNSTTDLLPMVLLTLDIDKKVMEAFLKHPRTVKGLKTPIPIPGLYQYMAEYADVIPQNINVRHDMISATE